MLYRQILGNQVQVSEIMSRSLIMTELLANNLLTTVILNNCYLAVHEFCVYFLSVVHKF